MKEHFSSRELVDEFTERQEIGFGLVGFRVFVYCGGHGKAHSRSSR